MSAAWEAFQLIGAFMGWLTAGYVLVSRVRGHLRARRIKAAHDRLDRNRDRWLESFRETGGPAE